MGHPNDTDSPDIHVSASVVQALQDDDLSHRLPLSHTIDDATQAIDLTTKISIVNSNVLFHGGFSDIYRGEWEQSDGAKASQVAVKLLRVFYVGHKGVDLTRARKRLNREVIVWRRLDHLNIAKFYGVSFQLGGRPALVMQWYNNGTAPNYLKGRSVTSRLTLATGVCAGMQYLHSLTPPVVHGDLKGNNILVDDDGQPVISDFGLSKVVDELCGPTGNTTSTALSAIYWRAPELHFDEDDEGEGEVLPISAPNLSSDVWSLGCTVYELLTGKIPYYYHAQAWRVSRDIITGVSPLRPDDVVIHESEELLGVLNACWALNPSKRPDMGMVTSRLKAISLV